MVEQEPTRTAEQIALIAVACAAVAAFSSAYHSRIGWLLVAPAAFSPFWRPKRVPSSVRSGFLMLARGVLLLTLLFGIAWSLYPVLPAALVQHGPRIVGHLLIELMALFVLGSAIWPPGGTVVPTALALLVISAFEKASRPSYEWVLLAAVALVAYALAADRTLRPPGTRTGVTLRAARVVVVVLAAAALAAAVVRVLPWAQPFVEGSVARALNPYVPYSGFADSTGLGSIEELALSPRVVMRVWTTQPQKLRARAYTRFDGSVWHAPPAEAGLPLRPATTAPAPDLSRWLAAVPGSDFLLPGESLAEAAEPQAIRTRIVQAEVEGALVTPEAALLVRVPHPDPRIDRSGVLRPLYPAPRVYGVINRRAAIRPTRQTLEAPAALRAEALALPPGLDPRLRALAGRLWSEGRNESERLQRTLGYLYTNCRYSLKVGSFRTKQPVAEFLFDKKRGYCEYFATAAAVLLRLQGIPTRYVAGFNVNDDNYRAGHYLVRESDAHAWIEVALPGAGWIEADPTPAAQYAELHPPPSRDVLSEALEWVQAKLAELSARLALGDPVELAKWLAREIWAGMRERPALPAAIVLGAALWKERGRIRRWRRPRRRDSFAVAAASAVPAELVALLARLEAELARAGCPRPDSRAPLEHLERLPYGRLSVEAQAAARRVVECYYQARFGGAVIAPDKIRELQHALAGGASIRPAHEPR